MKDSNDAEAQADRVAEIVICLGSSCFARGNAENLRAIKTYLEHYKLKANVTTCGALCHDKCTIGPTITINGVEHIRVRAGSAVGLLEQALKKQK